MKYLKGLILVGLLTMSITGNAWAAMSRYIVASQMNYDSKLGVSIAIGSDPDEGKTASIKNAYLTVNIADGDKWVWLNWDNPKFIFDKDYDATIKVKPETIEIWANNSKKSTKKIAYAGISQPLNIDGLPDWAMAPTEYIVVITALDITLSDGSKWKADIEPTAEYGKPITIVPDWRIPEDENNFEVHVTFKLVKAL
jgi:hypothetical protein